MPQLPQKLMLASEVVKRDSKIIILIRQSKSVTYLYDSKYHIFCCQGAHGDWIFDITWIDDQFVVSGSRDGSIALWRITDDMITEVTSSGNKYSTFFKLYQPLSTKTHSYCLIRFFFTEIPSHLYTTPLIKKLCKTADRVRSMCFNQRRSEIVVISSNGFIHCWDGLRYLNLIIFFHKISMF